MPLEIWIWFWCRLYSYFILPFRTYISIVRRAVHLRSFISWLLIFIWGSGMIIIHLLTCTCIQRHTSSMPLYILLIFCHYLLISFDQFWIIVPRRCHIFVWSSTRIRWVIVDITVRITIRIIIIIILSHQWLTYIIIRICFLYFYLGPSTWIILDLMDRT